MKHAEIPTFNEVSLIRTPVMVMNTFKGSKLRMRENHNRFCFGAGRRPRDCGYTRDPSQDYY